MTDDNKHGAYPFNADGDLILRERQEFGMELCNGVNQGPILTFTPDGRVLIGANLKPDEAAQQFLAVLAQIYPQWLRDPQQEAVQK